jgi:uncharacterized protein YcaQ
MTISLSLETARNLFVVKQGLHQRPAAPDRATLMGIVRQMGLLQLDTINVVDRSHYLVMLSRAGIFDRANMDALLYPDRDLFQWWGHAACYIPSDDYPYFAPLIAEMRQKVSEKGWWRDRLGQNPDAILAEVLDTVKERGPVSSKDFADSRESRGDWWDYKPAKAALSYLYDVGDIMVDRREKFRIFYDLAERIMPASSHPPTITIPQYQKWATHRSIGYMGVATDRQVHDYYRLKKSEARAMLDELLAENTIVPVQVAGWEDEAYMLTSDIPLAEAIANGEYAPQVTTLLSPFDPIMWNRDRVRDLFGFHYKLEIYVPKVKREYGYYVLSILHNGRLVGRLDPKVDRKRKTLILHNILLEPTEPLTAELLRDLAGAIQELMTFMKCKSLEIGETEPANLKQALLLLRESML